MNTISVTARERTIWSRGFGREYGLGHGPLKLDTFAILSASKSKASAYKNTLATDELVVLTRRAFPAGLEILRGWGVTAEWGSEECVVLDSGMAQDNTPLVSRDDLRAWALAMGRLHRQDAVIIGGFPVIADLDHRGSRRGGCAMHGVMDKSNPQVCSITRGYKLTGFSMDPSGEPRDVRLLRALNAVNAERLKQQKSPAQGVTVLQDNDLSWWAYVMEFEPSVVE